MSAFEQLKPEIRSYIWDEGWEELRPIQEATINFFFEEECNIVCASPTASGKTEAAFLPAISSIDDWREGVKIVYVSPLIALINDQFRRVNDLCDSQNIVITSWHGESSQAAKKKLLENPSGIVLITPESIEALLSRKPSVARHLFSDVETFIVDEMHNFIGSPRGTHLSSLLSRLNQFCRGNARYIGLSATLNKETYDECKKFFPGMRDTKVLVDHNRNSFTREIHFRESRKGIPSDMIDEIYEHSKHESLLVFPNSRGSVEEIAVSLTQRGARDQSLIPYFAHHSSVSKEIRSYVEWFAKSGEDQLFTICCTSTLELGVDIGAVDAICQVGAPPSAASLAQRLGRSGRRKNNGKLYGYATNPWSLLQLYASLELFSEGYVEKSGLERKPFTVLFQQILSLLVQHNGLTKVDLLKLLRVSSCWNSIENEEIDLLVDHMIETLHIQVVGSEMIVGIQGEKIVESKEFYSHFVGNDEYQVTDHSRNIGSLVRTPWMYEGDNVYLATKIWTIKSIDDRTKKIFVTPATSGKPPSFGGLSTDISFDVAQKMLRLLINTEALPSYLSSAAQNAILRLAQDLNITEADLDIPILIKNSEDNQVIFTFAGSQVNRTIWVLLQLSNPNLEVELDDPKGRFSAKNLLGEIRSLNSGEINKEELESLLCENIELLNILGYKYKYFEFLPYKLQARMAIEDLLDLRGANHVIKHLLMSI